MSRNLPVDASLSWNAPLLLLTLLAASLEPVLAKLGYAWGVDPWQLLYLKSLMGALLVIPLLLRHRPAARAVPAALLLLLTSACLLWAVRRLPAATVVTLASTTPAFVVLLNREKTTIPFWSGLLACLVGVVLSLGWDIQANSLDMLGLLFVAVAIASSSLYRTMLQTTAGALSFWQVSTTLFLVHGLLAVLAGPCLRPIPAGGYLLGLWLGVAGVAANLSFVYAVQLLGATRMSVFNLLQRPLVIVAAALLLGETLSLWQWLGVLLVLAGVRLAQSGCRKTGAG